MSKALHRFTLGFYNFTGISCLKFANGAYEISYFAAFVNILKLLLCIVTIFFISSSIEIQRKLFREVIIDIPKFSNFTKMSITFTAAYLHYISSALLICQLIHRQGMKEFMNNALFFKMNGIYFRRFMRLSVGSLRLTLFTFVGTVMKYYSIMNPSTINLLVYLVYIYPSIVGLGFVSFVKNFENYVIILLQKFDDDVKLVTSRTPKRFHGDVGIYLKFSEQYQKLFDFVNEFNELFGKQMTYITNSLTVVSVLIVILIRKPNIFPNLTKKFLTRSSM